MMVPLNYIKFVPKDTVDALGNVRKSLILKLS